jgi:hypothetical protein
VRLFAHDHVGKGKSRRVNDWKVVKGVSGIGCFFRQPRFPRACKGKCNKLLHESRRADYKYEPLWHQTPLKRGL